ncbi:MAG: TauD/TfdA family dioxygenase [Pseudomonadales bacterium]|jgi:alpha-ketoglutarate-dependent taurine dioxygenase|nr:TauD/TfdA family dioxygenase [Pseudomonadales bacterium]MDP7315624.1 TauD/TfdA family dioxygenase [Pseudomonadales bacterium]MDP7575828.1 TauD/TfdA family dioxygenase [Pseudomonadales bacterium]|tara:strand:+ start:728 stop:1582 length:855 start_codon:yes stop_codon:yes gene_type:complete
MPQLKIESLDATLGAVLTDVDLSLVDDDTWQAIHAAFLEYAVLIFPGQNITPEQHIAFGSRFGNIEEMAPGVQLVYLSNKLPDGSLSQDGEHLTQILRGVEVWHTDSSYMPLGSKGAVLAAQEIPPEGGQTEWADMRAGYDALSEEMKARIADLSAYHSLFYSQSQIGHKVEVGAGYGFQDKESPLRPLIKIHPETGRPALLIGRHAHNIPGMDQDESRKLLDELLEFACQPPRTYEHQWQPGDVIAWDNRCLMHRARPYDHHNQARVMRHVRIAGDPESELAA